MMQAVRGFNEQLKRIGEVAVVLVVGAMLAFTTVAASAAWFVLLLFSGGASRVGMAWIARRAHIARPAHPDFLVRHPRNRLYLLPDIRDQS